MSGEITPLVITFNEAPNIERVLSRLTWAKHVIVLDSGSADGTVEIAQRFANVEVVTRPFDGFASQCNYGHTLIATDWCLSLDADYVLPPETADEMQSVVREADAADGYVARLQYCIHGTPLSRAILPPRTVLYRVDRARYVQDGHAHKLVLQGRQRALRHPVLHDDRKSLARWLRSQDTYATQEVEKLLSARLRDLGWADRVRRLAVVAPWLVPTYYLFALGGVRDGWPGMEYAAQRAIAELILSTKLMERYHERLR